jgi:dihydrolipoamide dehydrogenase
MEKYDVLIIGSGSGMSIADGALNRGMKVAVVESGPLGGTCLNRGCIPSKNVIYP